MKAQKGFSLIELLVVVAIIGVLAGVGGIAYTNYLDGARAGVHDNNASLLERAINLDMSAREVMPDQASCNAVTSDTTAETCVETLISENNIENPWTGNNYTTAQVITGACGDDDAQALQVDFTDDGSVTVAACSN